MAVVRRRPAGAGQRVAAWTVLALLAAVAIWIGSVQSRPNPAVLVALSPPRPVGTAAGRAGGRTFATAAFLDALPGATPASAVESYDPETLSDRIDGKAELYLAANFKEMSVRSFTLPTGARLDAYIYAQAAPSDAYAVLSSQRRPGATPSTLSPDAYATPNALYFTKGNLYVELAADRADPATVQALEAAATALATKLPAPQGADKGAAAAIDPKSLFPQTGLDAASVRLAASDAMGLAGFSNVYTADYVLPSGAATALLALRESADAAAADAKAFAAFLTQNGYAAKDATGLPDGAVLLAADGSFEILWTKGRLLAGVHDAVSRQAALDLAGELAGRLKDVAP